VVIKVYSKGKLMKAERRCDDDQNGTMNIDLTSKNPSEKQ
jgi:hypothetical protein